MNNLEQRQTEFAQAFGLTLESYRKLASSVNHTELVTCLELLKAAHPRSRFRSSCKAQIQRWLNDEGAPHLKPLSPQQFKLSTPKWPIHYTIPN